MTAGARTSHDLTATFTGEVDDILDACLFVATGIGERDGACMVFGSFEIHAAEGATLTVRDGDPFTITWRWETGDA